MDLAKTYSIIFNSEAYSLIKSLVASKNNNIFEVAKNIVKAKFPCFNRKTNAAFTLAETLITLMVIGVVAALTVPSLMTAYKDRQMATAKKKAHATLSNGYKLMAANEDASIFSELPMFTCNKDFSCLSAIHHKYFNVGFDKKGSDANLASAIIKSDGTGESDFEWKDVPYVFSTSDGMAYGMYQDDFYDTLDTFSVVVDVNGEKSPNQAKKDLYKFRVSANEVVDVSGELDDPKGCSAKNITKCTTQDELDTLRLSLTPGRYTDYPPYTMLDDTRCFIMTWSDNPWYDVDGRLPYGYDAYAIVTRGSRKTKGYYAEPTDVFEHYCH